MKKIYLTTQDSQGNLIRGYILDISRSGMGIACTKRIKKNALIEIISKDNILLPMSARVLSILRRQAERYYKYRLGVKFISIEKERKERLEKFLRRIEQRKAARLTLLYIWKQE